MANAYFTNFPLVNYEGKITRNIINRSRFIQEVLKNYWTFYPFVISDGMTWEQIAYAYYGDCDLDWLCYFSNSTFDPYYEFPLSQEVFDNLMATKYGSWEAAQTTVDHYVYKSPDANYYIDPNISYTEGYQMTPMTYSFLTPVQQSYWKPVTCYDNEFALNEAKRTIQLLDNRLKEQVLNEIREIMK